MTTLSNRLRLIQTTTSDRFVTADLASNLGTLDASPGRFICTSITRPTTWGANQEGMEIFEKDSRLVWRWDGVAFYRTIPMGWLNGFQKTSDSSTASLTPVVAVQVSTNVPAGGRRIQVAASWPRAEGTTGQLAVSLFRNSTQLDEWIEVGDSTSLVATTQGRGGSHDFFDVPPVSGTYVYSLQLRAVAAFGGTVYIRGSVGAPTCLDVIEL